MRWRLSLLMLLNYAVPGALVPLFSARLQDLGFTPMEMGWACATQSLASLAAPLVAGQVADRWLPAQLCLAFCGLGAGGLLWLLAGLTGPFAVCAVSLAAWVLIAPALTLGVALAFGHLARPARDYGRVRLWGTVGWVVPGWLLGYWFSDPGWAAGLLAWVRPALPHSERADAFRLAALLAVALGLYALTLPHTPPRPRRGPTLAALAAFRLLWDRAFAVFWVGVLGVCATVPFTTQLTPLLLEDLGVPYGWLGPLLTISQSMELVSLAILPTLLHRLGMRGTMRLGLLAWAADLALLTVGRPVGLVIGSMALNGICICCFLVAGQVFVNSRARDDLRASAQALVTFMNGLGMLTGNLLVGWVRRQAAGEFRPTFAAAAVITAALAVFFFAGFPADETAAPAPASGGVPGGEVGRASTAARSAFVSGRPD